MNKKLLILLFIVILGIAVPKLTVKDAVQVDGEFRNNIMEAISVHYDNPLQKIALLLGKSRIVSATELSAEIESFTMFNIPLGFFYGIPDMKLSVNFNADNDWSVNVESDDIVLSPDDEEENNENNEEDVSDVSLETFFNEEQNVKFEYPKELNAGYISTVSWPPVLSISEEKLVCEETAPESSLPKGASFRKINGKNYCVEFVSEGAAGSVYTEYDYSTVIDGKLIKMSFTLQYPRCDNYDDPKKTECSEERESSNLDEIIDGMISSLEYVK